MSTEHEMQSLKDILAIFESLADDMARKRVLQYVTDLHTETVRQKYVALNASHAEAG